MNFEIVNVIGAGLAGSEAAWQLARRGVRMRLYEMRPVRMTEAHRTHLFAELVCSNSLRNASIETAVGVLKEEMRRLGSLIIAAADQARVLPAERSPSIAKALRPTISLDPADLDVLRAGTGCDRLHQVARTCPNSPVAFPRWPSSRP